MVMKSDLHVNIVTGDDATLRKELEFKRLNSLGFVRGTTSQEQFFLLVNDAWEKTGLPPNEVLRDYLAVMLNRFANRPDLLDQLAGFEYCSYLIGWKQVDKETVHDLADISLQYVAFFPGMSMRRHEPRSLEYSAKIGESLYAHLAKDSTKKDDWFSEAWKTMAGSFGRAVMVLRSVFPQYAYERAAQAPERGQVAQTEYEATTMLDQYKLFDLMFFQQQGGTPLRN